MGLASRALELAGIATVIISWSMGFTQVSLPARALYTPHGRGSTLGPPGDAGEQRRVLNAGLALFGQPAPVKAKLDEG